MQPRTFGKPVMAENESLLAVSCCWLVGNVIATLANFTQGLCDAMTTLLTADY